MKPPDHLLPTVLSNLFPEYENLRVAERTLLNLNSEFSPEAVELKVCESGHLVCHQRSIQPGPSIL